MLCLFPQEVFSFAVLSAQNQETAIPFFAPGGASYMKLRPFFTRSSPMSNLQKKRAVWDVTHRTVTLVTQKNPNQYEIAVITSIFSFVNMSNKIWVSKNPRDQSMLLRDPLCTKNHTFQSQLKSSMSRVMKSRFLCDTNVLLYKVTNCSVKHSIFWN